MSNFDRAVKALNDVDDLYGALVSNEDYVTILQGRGLLAPDLPAPSPYSEEVPSWYEGTFEISISRLFSQYRTGVTFLDSEPGGRLHMDTEAARELAHALLAAADYAEKEQGNE